MRPRTRSIKLVAGIAALLTLTGAFGSAIVSATEDPPTVNPVLTTITPCRLVDTRPAPDNVGPRNTPLGNEQTYTTAARGSNGNCQIPIEAIGLVLNVTVIGGTSSSYLQLWPADQPKPLASNLNWRAGQGATANQATVALSADGEMSVYNNRGTVNVVVDVTGYLTDHNHDARYYTKAEADLAEAAQDEAMAELEATVASLSSELSALDADTYSKAEIDALTAGPSACAEFPHVAVNWEGCDLTGAYLVHANLINANLTNANLTDAKIGIINEGDAKATGLVAAGLVAAGSSWREVDMSSSNLEGADLSGANLRSSNLSHSNLRYANLTGADLSWANLYKVDLTGATIDGILASSTNWNDTTCPDGSNSYDHSNTCVGYGV